MVRPLPDLFVPNIHDPVPPQSSASTEHTSCSSPFYHSPRGPAQPAPNGVPPAARTSLGPKDAHHEQFNTLLLEAKSHEVSAEGPVGFILWHFASDTTDQVGHRTSSTAVVGYAPPPPPVELTPPFPVPQLLVNLQIFRCQHEFGPLLT